MSKDDQEQKDTKSCPFSCPLSIFFEKLDQNKKKHKKAFDHFHNAEREILLAIKAFIDEQLAPKEKSSKKATKIKVEQ